MEAQREAAKREIEESRAGGHADQVEWERQKMMTICRSLNVEMVEMNPNGHWSVALSLCLPRCCIWPRSHLAFLCLVSMPLLLINLTSSPLDT